MRDPDRRGANLAGQAAAASGGGWRSSTATVAVAVAAKAVAVAAATVTAAAASTTVEARGKAPAATPSDPLPRHCPANGGRPSFPRALPLCGLGLPAALPFHTTTTPSRVSPPLA